MDGHWGGHGGPRSRGAGFVGRDRLVVRTVCPLIPPSGTCSPPGEKDTMQTSARRMRAVFGSSPSGRTWRSALRTSGRCHQAEAGQPIAGSGRRSSGGRAPASRAIGGPRRVGCLSVRETEIGSVERNRARGHGGHPPEGSMSAARAVDSSHEVVGITTSHGGGERTRREPHSPSPAGRLMTARE